MYAAADYNFVQMQRVLFKLETAIDKIDSLFLGVVESQIQHKIGERSFTILLTDSKGFYESIQGKPLTQCVQCLLNAEIANDGAVNLMFTNNEMWERCKSLNSMQIVRVLDMELARYGRTILEVQLNGIAMVLKVIDTRKKQLYDNVVHTHTEDEVISFDRIPEDLKSIFVQKYAHGRFYLANYCPEIILMEKMFPISLQSALGRQSFSLQQKMSWYTQAIEKLLKIHKAGFFHGDCHSGNILWTDDVGIGDMKWIDPERMISMIDLDEKTKAVYAIQEIYNIFMHTGFFNGKIMAHGFSVDDINFPVLSSRFEKIKKGLSRDKQADFMFPDIIMFDISIRGNNGDGIITSEILQQLSTHSRYTNIESVNYDLFLQKLTDPNYLENSLEYTVLQCIKAHRNDLNVSQEDLAIPSNTPSIRMKPNKMQPTTSPSAPNAMYPATKPVIQGAPQPQITVIRLHFISNGHSFQITNERNERYSYFNDATETHLYVKQNNSDYIPVDKNFLLKVFYDSNGTCKPLMLSNHLQVHMLVSNKNLLLAYKQPGATKLTFFQTFDMTQTQFVLS